MKCKDCPMCYLAGKCECGREIYICTEESPTIVKHLDKEDWCDGIEDG